MNTKDLGFRQRELIQKLENGWYVHTYSFGGSDEAVLTNGEDEGFVNKRVVESLVKRGILFTKLVYATDMPYSAHYHTKLTPEYLKWIQKN